MLCLFLSLLALIWQGWRKKVPVRRHSAWVLMDDWRLSSVHHHFIALLNGNVHVTSIAAFAPISLVFADAAINTNAGVLAATAWALTITSLLALAAALAARLGGQILFVRSKLILEVDGGSDRGLARLRRQ
jgi:hypothetical protein